MTSRSDSEARSAATRFRLWLAKLVLPRGYALWTYGQQGEAYGLDFAIIEKELHRG